MSLSRRAQKLLVKVRAGEFYEAYSKQTPKAMQELIDAGLVIVMGRVVKVAAFYVPTGTKPFKLEELP